MTNIVTLQMLPRTRRQATADRKGKRVMIEKEPQRTDRAEEPHSPHQESLASIVQPEKNLVGRTGPRMDGAGPSRPPVREIRPTQPEEEIEGRPKPNTTAGVDMDVLVQVITDVARNVMKDMLKDTNAQNQERQHQERPVIATIPIRTEIPPPIYDLRNPFDGSRDLALVKEFM